MITSMDQFAREDIRRQALAWGPRFWGRCLLLVSANIDAHGLQMAWRAILCTDIDRNINGFRISARGHIPLGDCTYMFRLHLYICTFVYVYLYL